MIMQRKEFLWTITLIILVTYTSTIFIVMQVFPASQTTVTLTSSGSIQTTEGIGAYSNLACTTPQTSISWGALEKGDSTTVTIYIRNEGDSPLTLSLSTSDWNPPSIDDYLTLSWNYNNQPINPNAVVQINLTLSVDPDAPAVSNFGVNLLIVGTT